MAVERVHVGASGWSYPTWRGAFYPPGLRQGEFLSFYARHFHTVELNSTFYGLPRESTVQAWREAVPDGFLFAVKASRFITHFQRLRASPQAMDTLFARVRGLGDRLGPALFQLPPDLECDLPLLASFLDSLPRGCRYAVEFRHESWFQEPVYGLLRERNVAFCVTDLARRLKSPVLATSDMAYVRLHGAEHLYSGRYSEGALHEWAGRCFTWAAEGRDVFVYFDNTGSGEAVLDALSLQGMVSALAVQR